jgi:hypothetical protein
VTKSPGGAFHCFSSEEECLQIGPNPGKKKGKLEKLQFLFGEKLQFLFREKLHFLCRENLSIGANPGK